MIEYDVEIALARGDGTYRELMRKYRKYKLLILDEWLLYPLKETEARDLLELIESRSQVASTYLLSTYRWHELLYDPMADAICDCIVYNSHVLTIQGESMRRLNAISI